MTYATQAIVLKKISTGEMDAFVILYTRDFGKVRAFIQGVKKENAKLKGHVEPLSLISTQFVIGASGERLTYAQMLQSWPAIRNNFDRYGAASYMSELVDRHCFLGERDNAIWELLVSNFAVIEKCRAVDVPEAIQSFERDFLQCLGPGAGQDISMLGSPLARPFGMV